MVNVLFHKTDSLDQERQRTFCIAANDGHTTTKNSSNLEKERKKEIG
jgi:hypothetical protein